MLGVDVWLNAFHQDMQLYRGDVNDLVNNILQSEKAEGQSQNPGAGICNSSLIRNLRLASAFFYLRQLPVSHYLII